MTDPLLKSAWRLKETPRLRVTELVQTCETAPAQWEGRIDGGGWIYVRQRHDELNIGIGNTLESAVMASMSMAPNLPFLSMPSDWINFHDLVALTDHAIKWPSADRVRPGRSAYP